MKYINVPIQLISALKPSQFRPFKDLVLKNQFKTYQDHIFKGEDRIYIPLNKEEIPPPREIKGFLSRRGYSIVDYKMGLAKKENGRLTKIASLLDEDYLQNMYSKSREGSKKGNLLIVISRHPYDIAGMSTGRGWTSCMNLDNGLYKEYIHKDIENGLIVAYIIDPEDTNIKHPIGRLLLKQYINIRNKNDVILYPDNKIHGTNIPGFRNTIIEWLKSFQSIEGTYQLNLNVYRDGADLLIGLGEKDSPDLEINRLYYMKNPEDSDAKKSKVDRIRSMYFNNHPDDEDAKYDVNNDIRLNYFLFHPEDKDAKDDIDERIKGIYYDSYPEDTDKNN